jgi:hypothetical protein
MVNSIRLKIYWWSLTVLYSLTCCWLYLSANSQDDSGFDESSFSRIVFIHDCCNAFLNTCIHTHHVSWKMTDKFFIKYILTIQLTSSMAQWSVRSVRSRKLSNVLKRAVIGWVTKIYYLELLRASEGTLSCWSRLHLLPLVPTPVSRRVDFRKAACRKNNCRMFITPRWKSCCTDPI